MGSISKITTKFSGLSVWVKFHSVIHLSPPQRFKRSLYQSAVQSVPQAQSRMDRSGGEPLPDVCRFLVHPCRFLVHRWISWLWLNLTAWNWRLCGYSLRLFFRSLISYFLRNEAKCFTLKACPKPVGVVVHVVFFSWNNNNSPLQKREGTGASFLYWLDWKSKH